MRPTTQLRRLYRTAGRVNAVSLRAIISMLGDNSFALLLLLFALLSVALTPIPGLTTVLCLPMTILAWQWVQGHRAVALPARIAAQTIPAYHFRTALTKILPALVWLEKYCSKRAPELMTESLRTITRTTLLLLCLTLLIPIPFTHIIPDIAIITVALGELEDDGVMMMAGLLLGVLVLCAFIVLGMLLLSGFI